MSLSNRWLGFVTLNRWSLGEGFRLALASTFATIEANVGHSSLTEELLEHKHGDFTGLLFLQFCPVKLLTLKRSAGYFEIFFKMAKGLIVRGTINFKAISWKNYFKWKYYFKMQYYFKKLKFLQSISKYHRYHSLRLYYSNFSHSLMFIMHKKQISQCKSLFNVSMSKSYEIIGVRD